MRDITIDDLDDIALGAAVLGTGGGGDPYIGKLLARATMTGKPPVSAPRCHRSRRRRSGVPDGDDGRADRDGREDSGRQRGQLPRSKRWQKFLGQKVAATMPMEAGGVNSMIPFAVAAQLGIPLVDADGMGRAFPELQMVTPTIWGIPATPMAIADDKGNSAILQTISNQWTETFARSLTVDMGASASISLYPMTGKQVKEATIPGSVTLIQDIGRAIRRAQYVAHRSDPGGL